MVRQLIWRGRHRIRRQSGALDDRLGLFHSVNGDFGVAGTVLGGCLEFRRIGWVGRDRFSFFVAVGLADG